MKNFSFKHQGKELWYSRSLACNLITVKVKERWFHKEIYVLANRRGPGCEFNKGFWNVPGGFIDFDEDSIECAIRETKEECGIDIPREKIKFIDLDTRPRGKRQTMVATHAAVVSYKDFPDEIVQTDKSSDCEADLVKWIDIRDLYKYSWVPGQEQMIKRVLKQLGF